MKTKNLFLGLLENNVPIPVFEKELKQVHIKKDCRICIPHFETIREKKMKKVIVATNVLILLLLSTPAMAEIIPVYDETGRMIVLQPTAQENAGCTMAPIWPIAKYLNATVEWEEPTVFIRKGETQLILHIGSQIAVKEAEGKKTEIQLERAPYLKEDRVIVPLRFVLEELEEQISFYSLRSDHAIILGNHQYDGSIEYERIPWNLEDEEKLKNVADRYQKNNVYDYRVIWSVCDHFLFQPLNQITNSYGYRHIYDSKTAEEMYINYSYYLSDDVQKSQGWQDFLGMVLTSRSDLEGYMIDVFSTGTTIRGTFCVGLFSVLYDIPLVFEAELTKQDNAWLAAAPQSTLEGWQNPGEYGPWQITDLSNPRSYLNMQSLRQAEPEIYNQLIGMRQYHNNILQ